MFGPILLIALGVLFLLGTMGLLHWSNLGRWFAHYWPLILIFAGVVKLLEYQSAQRAGYRPRGLGAGSIFLVIVFIVIGLAATQAARFNWDAVRDNINIDDGDFEWFGHTYNYDDQLQQAFPANATLHINNDRGAVTLSTSEDNQIHVAVHKRIGADSQQDADKYNEGTKPQITASDNVVTLNANTQGAGEHRVSTDMDVSIPRKAAVLIVAKRGDVNIMGRDGSVDLTSGHGDISMSDINGKINLNLDRSSARISQVNGDISVDGRANDVSFEDVKGSVRLNGEFLESIKVARVTGTVSFRSSRTDLEFANLKGDLDLDSGDLRASDITGPVRLITRSKDIRLDGVSGDVRVKDENGTVELRMNKLGSIDLDNRKGDIELYLPEKAAFQVNARARNGEVSSDFNDLRVENANDVGTASGSVGSNGPRININNEHGTIDIRRGSISAEAPEAPPAPKAPRVPKNSAPPEPTDN
jgi:DUF4097 and DUF4098 domain-containing protein YvlB